MASTTPGFASFSQPAPATASTPSQTPPESFVFDESKLYANTAGDAEKAQLALFNWLSTLERDLQKEEYVRVRNCLHFIPL